MILCELLLSGFMLLKKLKKCVINDIHCVIKSIGVNKKWNIELMFFLYVFYILNYRNGRPQHKLQVFFQRGISLHQKLRSVICNVVSFYHLYTIYSGKRLRSPHLRSTVGLHQQLMLVIWLCIWIRSISLNVNAFSIMLSIRGDGYLVR